MKEKENLCSHLEDLQRVAEERGYITVSGFLSEEEQAAFRKRNRAVQAFVFPFPENGERQVLLFFSSLFTEEDCRTYAAGEDGPVVLLEIRGKQEKFAEELSHRDVLGAVMHLGITREQVGDILFRGKTVYLYLLRKMKAYVMENMRTIRHTAVELREVSVAEAVE